MRPTGRTLWLLCGFVALGVLASIWPVASMLWVSGGAAIGTLLLIDGLLVRQARLSGERALPPTLAIGVRVRVGLVLQNVGKRTCRLRVHDHHPAALATTRTPLALEIPAGMEVSVSYEVTPTERGAHDFARIDCLVASPLALWRRRLLVGQPSRVRVYPNFQAVVRYTLLALENRVQRLGIQKRRRRGLGTEFHQLRAYRAGDSLRQIDWAATSRLRKPISREYQDEQNQQVVFLLDTSRRMRARDGALSHLDRVLDSLLLLTHVALRQGDAVGLMTFGGQRRWLAPRTGAEMLRNMLSAVYDLTASTEASDIQAAAEMAMTKLRKRSLIVLLSNLRDEEDPALLHLLTRLRQRHLVVLASLRDPEVTAPLDHEPRDAHGALRVAAIHQYMEARARSLARLRKAGFVCVDTEPAALPPALVNAYLTIKASHAL